MAAPRVRYSARQLPAERRCRMAAPRVRYSARQVPTRSGYEIAVPGVSYYLSILPPPLAALSHSPWRINEYVASGSARQVLRASAKGRERM